MVDDTLAHTHPQLSLDARYYTDPDLFKAEQQGMLSRTWQFAGHCADISEAGAYMTFSIAGENLFCIRDHSGEIKTYYNVCQHRAHELLNGRGKLNSRLIVCPYHAWSYNLNGQLMAAPNSEVVDGFDRKAICLTEVRTELLHGFIFVNLDPDAKSMDDWFPGVRAELAAFVPDIERLKPVRWVTIPEACNWKVSIENYSECYHCQLNHPTFSTGVVKPETYRIEPQGYCLRHTTQCQNLDSMTYPVDTRKNAHAGDYSAWFLWPMFSFQVYPGNILNTYHWHAIDVDHVVVVRGWYTPDGRTSDVINNLAQQDRDTTVAEDIKLVESVSRGLKSRGYNPGPLVLDPARGVKSEHSVARLQAWMREAVDGASGTT